MSRYNAIIQEDVASIVQELATPLRVLSGTTLLVTGGGGFLCSYFLDTVAHWNDTSGLSPCRMVCLDNLASGLPQRLAHLTKRSDFRLVRYDVSQPLALNESITWIIHGASIASPIVYRRLPIETMEVNANGTRHLLDVARQRRSRSMLYLSSSEIYGDPTAEWVPTPETYRGNVSCIGPRACYDESKRMGETWCWVYFRQHGVPVKIVRPFNVYGPGQRLDDGRIIPDLVSAMLDKKPIVLFSDGTPTRAFCYVRDAIRAMWLILLSDANGEAFNVGNDAEELSMRQVAECARETAGGPPWLEIEYRLSVDRDYVADVPKRRCPDLSKLRSKFAWKSTVNLKEGLQRTLASYQVQQTAIPGPPITRAGAGSTQNEFVI